MSPDHASQFGANFLGSLGPKLKKTVVFRRIIHVAFPELKEEGIERLSRDVWRNLGSTLAEYPHLAEISSDPDRIEVQVADNLKENLAGNRGTIFVAAHQANWEIPGAMPRRYGLTMTVVYSELSNKIIDRMLRKKRLAMGCRLVERASSMKELVNELKNGRMAGMIIDNREDGGTPIPFMGAPKLTTLAPARLALKLGVDLAPVRIIRAGPAKFKVVVVDPIKPSDPTADKRSQAIDMMTQVNMHFEKWIRERPNEWYCGKRPWAKDIFKQKSLAENSAIATGI